jgi:hypothetical protein
MMGGVDGDPPALGSHQLVTLDVNLCGLVVEKDPAVLGHRDKR